MAGGDKKALTDFSGEVDIMFDTAFIDLPEDVQREVARQFSPLSWWNLTPRRREQLAREVFGEALDGEDEFVRRWKLHAQRAELRRQVSEWWRAAAPTVADKRAQQERIAALRAELEDVDKAIDDLEMAPEGASAGQPEDASTGEPEDAEEWALEQWMHGTRADAIDLDIQAALESLGENASPTTVMRYLRNLVRKPDTSVVGLAPDGVIWRRHHGEVEKLTKKNLADRLRRRRKRAGTR